MPVSPGTSGNTPRLGFQVVADANRSEGLLRVCEGEDPGGLAAGDYASTVGELTGPTSRNSLLRPV
jgi:hypothetical protein